MRLAAIFSVEPLQSLPVSNVYDEKATRQLLFFFSFCTSHKISCRAHSQKGTQSVKRHVCHVARLVHFVRNASQRSFNLLKKKKNSIDRSVFPYKTLPM